MNTQQTAAAVHGVNDFAYGVMRSVARQILAMRLIDSEKAADMLEGHIADASEETKAAFLELLKEEALS